MEEILQRVEEIRARARMPEYRDLRSWAATLAVEDVPWLCRLARRLMGVAEAAQSLLTSHEVCGYRQTDEGLVPMVGEQELLSLKQALAALEEGN